MSYNVHVTRKEDWSDADGPEITRDEWVTYLTIDKTLELDRERAQEVDSRVASGAKEPTHVRWKEWPNREKGVREAWMWLENGNIVASDADSSFRIKMFLVADSLNARLMGDGGEVYNSIGEPEKGRQRLTAEGRKRAWWKFW